MTDPATTPVVIGVADLRSGRAGAPAAPREPLDLIHDAARAALADTALPAGGPDALTARIDAIHAVATAGWSYDDLPGLLAARLGARPARTSTSPLGGQQSAELLDRIAHDIAAGVTSAALLVGGEAQASVNGIVRAGDDPAAHGWTTAPGGPPAFEPDDLGSTAMRRAGMVAPTRVYPLFENRLSYELGHSRAQSQAWSAALYAAFSRVAAAHPAAWSDRVRTAAEILTVGPGNRMITDPYPLLVNAMPFVDQAAAVVVTSLATARSLQVPENRLLYVWGGAGATEPLDVLARADLGRSAALDDARHRLFARAGVGPDDLDIVDAYGCFPVVPKLIVEQLGLPRETVPSVTGGHSFFGGPLNSYTLHSVVAVARRLRDGAGLALVHGNGGYLTHQHLVLLGRTPHPDGYVGDPEPVRLPPTGPALADDYTGVIEIYTAAAEYDRSGNPAVGFLIGTTPDGRRVAGRTGHDSARFLAAGADVVGRTVRVHDDGETTTVEPA